MPLRLQGDCFVPYQSKISEFEDFAARTKMAALPLGPSAASAAASASSEREFSQITSTGTAPGIVHTSAARTAGLPGATDSPPPSAPCKAPLSLAIGSARRFGPQSKLLVMDDLPHASDPEQRSRLAGTLSDLLMTARFPTVVMGTEVTNRGGASEQTPSNTAGLHPVRPGLTLMSHGGNTM